MSEEKSKVRYATDKPKECKKCFWWDPMIKGCKLGEKNCYYILPDKKPIEKTNPCMGCPYGKNGPCIGFCMRNLLKK